MVVMARYPGTPGTTPSNLKNLAALFFGRRRNKHRRRTQLQSHAINALCDATKTGTYRFTLLTHFPVLDSDLDGGLKELLPAPDEGMHCPLRCSHGEINRRFDMAGV